MQKQKKTPRKITASYLENAALYYLQRYATSVHNLRNILIRKIKRSCHFHGDDVEKFYPLVENLLSRYQTSGLLNDQSYATSRVISLRREGKSKQAIIQRLCQKGLKKEDVKNALEVIDQDDQNSDFASALHLARKKKIGPYRTETELNEKLLHREMGILARAGFSYEIARRIVQKQGTEETLF